MAFSSPSKYPRSTYRVQFREGMTFDRAAALVPYLKRLGISHLYASPIFTAASGSTHGYDVANANKIDPSIGGRDGFDRMSAALKSAGLGLILDIVPNHMAASLENAWWRSVVEWGRDSPFANYFDIDWRRKLTLPMLGKPLEDIVADGDLFLAFDPDAGVLSLAYFDNLIPLHPGTYANALADLEHPIATRIAALAAQATEANSAEFHEKMKASIAGSEIVSSLNESLRALSNDGERLRSILDIQPWQLIYWKRAASELSYRRFFEVTGLAGLRVEDPEVFAQSHRLTLELVRSGQVDGLRIDHIDGLVDPKQYLERLRAEAGPETYIVVEKILGEGERLPASWPISGTSGYEFITALSNVFIDSSKANELDRAYAEVADDMPDYAAALRDAKLLLIEKNLAVETTNLLKLLTSIAALDGDPSEQAALQGALRDILIVFPVYRTYGTKEQLDEADVALWDKVLTAVAGLPEPPDAKALALVDRVFKGDVPSEARPQATEFRLRFQQLTGPLTAKSIEDTTFYRFHRLIALNEVGGEPVGHDLSLDGFHQAMAERAGSQPHGLSASSTHDTKRGEDARARLYAISEAPDVWRDAVNRWSRMNGDRVTRLDDGPAPEPEVEWLLYQALAGVWPADLGDRDPPDDLEPRFLAYVEKALREAKLRSNWGEENASYEGAVKRYAANLLSPDNGLFLADFRTTLKPFLRAGLFNGLTQTLIKLTAPGVPDIYQGAEALDLSLVDPDNRRIPDFETLSRNLDHRALTQDDAKLRTGALKQLLVAKGLALRNAEPMLFGEGDYEPLQVTGRRSDQVVAFSRSLDEVAIVTVAPRFLVDLGETDWPCGAYWGDCALTMPDQLRSMRWSSILDGGSFEGQATPPLASLLGDLPIALLIGRR